MEVSLNIVKIEETYCSETEHSCRLCLLDDGIKINIFDDEGADRNVADKISTCFPIVIYKTDPLPKSICHKCLFKLETTYEFRQLCLESNELLKSKLPLNTNNSQILEYCNSLKRTAQETLQIISDLKDAAVNTDSVDMLTDSQSSNTSTAKRKLSVDNLLTIEVKSEIEDFDPSQLVHNTDIQEDSIAQTSILESVTEETSFNDTIEDNSVTNEQPEHPGVSDVCEESTENENNSYINKKLELHPKHPIASTNKNGPGSSRKSTKRQQYLQWCIFCQKYLKNKQQLWKHKARCHQVYRCKCKKGFFTLNDMLKHQISHLKVVANFKDKNMHACTVCDKKFADPEVLRLHTIIHNPGFLCTPNFNSFSIKNIGVRSELYLKKRNQEAATYNDKKATSPIKSSQNVRIPRVKAVKAPNDSVEVCICKYCDSVFPDPKKMWHHMKTDHKFGLYKCKICNREFKTSSNLGTHMAWHSRVKITHSRWFKPTRKPVNIKVCGLCNCSFKTKGEYVLHLSDCKTRNDILPSTSIQMYEKGKVLLPCPLCKMIFGEPSALSLHLQSHTVENQNSNDCLPKMYQCSYCSKEFASRSGLYRHERKHLTGKLAKFNCKLCGKKFMSDESFSAHLSTHSFSKTYHCNFCNKIFFNEKLRTNHACSFKIPNLNSQCCGISFIDAASAANHVCGEASGTTPNSGNLKSSILNTIDMLKKKAHLHKSIIISTDIGYKCILCEEEFATQQSAAGHCRVHKERVKCPFCNRFINAESIYKHILVYHPDVSKQF